MSEASEIDGGRAKELAISRARRMRGGERGICGQGGSSAAPLTSFILFTSFTYFTFITLITICTTLPASAQAPVAPGAARFVVVIDAAHGGDDAGARLTSGLEKNYTLALSVRLRSLLMARGMTVVTTRESDSAVDADRRAEIANRAIAAACLSLHAAGSSAKSGSTGPSGSSSTNGPAIHIFVSSLPAAAEEARFLPWNTAQAAWVTRSVALAGVLNSALAHAGMTVTLGRTALPVVDSMACPAVAIEVAPEQAANAQGGRDDSAGAAQVAEALAAALVEWRSEEMGGRR